MTAEVNAAEGTTARHQIVDQVAADRGRVGKTLIRGIPRKVGTGKVGGRIFHRVAGDPAEWSRLFVGCYECRAMVLAGGHRGKTLAWPVSDLQGGHVGSSDSAVRRERRSSHERRIVRGKIKRGARHLAGFPKPAHGDVH